ncbi:MAG: endonuclease [Microbacteriaceae bacterium]|nr:endonuclease [Microbacteriaceae bacterium]
MQELYRVSGPAVQRLPPDAPRESPSRRASHSLRVFIFTLALPLVYAQEVLVRHAINHWNVGGGCENFLMSHPTPLLVDELIDPEAMSDDELLGALEEGFARRHEADSRIVRLATAIIQRSRSSLGAGGLASKTGYASPATLLADIGRISLAEAHRICRVAEGTTARRSLIGEHLPAEYPVVAEAVRGARIPVDSASAIIAAIAQASPRADAIHLEAAERALVQFAVENPVDAVRKLAACWRDALDVDGIEPREDELVAARTLHRTILANGLKRYRLDLDPVSSAFMDAAIDAQVGVVIRAPRFDSPEDDENVPDPRALTQIAADAVVDLARHGIACVTTDVPLPSATIVVRMTLESLIGGRGVAQIDGIEQPISATTARRMAADARLIPVVLGGSGEVLDLGVSRRLFSTAQRVALAERDGGCAWGNCARPPSHTEAHHIEWWSRGGETNLANGTSL